MNLSLCQIWRIQLEIVWVQNVLPLHLEIDSPPLWLIFVLLANQLAHLLPDTGMVLVHIDEDDLRWTLSLQLLYLCWGVE